MLTKTCTDPRPESRLSGRLLTRTALPIFAVGAVLLAAGIYGAWRVHRLHKRGSEILSDNVASIRAAEELETVVRELRHRLKRHVSSGNERHLAHIHDLIPQGIDALDEAESLAGIPREQQLVTRLREGYSRFRRGFTRLLEERGDEAQAQTALNLADEVLPNKVLVHTRRYIELNEHELARSSERNQSTANQLMFGLLLLGTCGGVTGLLAGYGIARLVNRTIVQLAVPIRDAAGQLNQVAGPVAVAAKPELEDLQSILKTVSDHVTTVVHRLQESERDRLRAEQLAAVGQLAAGLAHELRNPLTSMKAILQLADQPSDLTRRDLDILQEEAGRLEQSVQSLLDFARPPQPRKSDTELGDLLEQATDLVRRSAERQGVTLAYLPPPLGMQLSADALQLRQVVLNLLLNAIDVTPRGGRVQLESWLEELEAAPQRRSPSGGKPRRGGLHRAEVVICVSDTGPGLPPELGERIFDPFVTSKETGTGLGLSICRRIVEAHGGQVTAVPRAGGGAAFEVRLPRPTRPHPGGAAPGEPSATPTGSEERTAAVGSERS